MIILNSVDARFLFITNTLGFDSFDFSIGKQNLIRGELAMSSQNANQRPDPTHSNRNSCKPLDGQPRDLQVNVGEYSGHHSSEDSSHHTVKNLNFDEDSCIMHANDNPSHQATIET